MPDRIAVGQVPGATCILREAWVMEMSGFHPTQPFATAPPHDWDYVRPYVNTQKNDDRDAERIGELATTKHISGAPTATFAAA